MADVRYDLEVSDGVAAPLREAAAAALASADAHDEATAASRRAADAARDEADAARAAARAAQEAADAQRRLSDVVLAVASAEERARVLHERRRAEILRLATVSGDMAAGQAALAANDTILARSLASVADEAATAGRRLQDMGAAVASSEDRARLAHARRREEIERLSAASGDAVAAARAMEANDRALAAALMGGADASDRAARATGGLGRALQAVGQQMPDIVTQLQMGANPLTVLTQQGSQVAEVLIYTSGGAGGLAAALGSLVPVVVGVGAALAAVVLAWKSLTGELDANTAATDENNKQTVLAADAQRRLQSMLEDTRDTLRELRVVTGEMTDEQAELAQASEQAYARWQAATRETRAELQQLRREQASTSTQIVDGLREMIVAVDDFAGLDPTADLAVFDYLFTTGDDIAGRIDTLTGAMDRSVKAAGENADAHKALVKAEDEKAGADGRSTRSTRAATDAERERARAIDEARRAMTAASAAAAALLRGPLSERDRLLESADALYAIATSADTTRMQAAALEGQIEALLARVAELDAAPEIELRLQVSAAVDALTRQIDEAIVQGVVLGGRAAAREVERQRIGVTQALAIVGQGGGGRGAQAVGGAMMQGGFSQAVAGGGGAAMAGVGAGLMAAGGAASAAVAAVRVVAGLDEMESGIREVGGAAAQNLKRLDELLPGIADALGDVVASILENLPEILAALVKGIALALVELGRSIIMGLVRLGQRIVDAILPGDQSGRNNGSRVSRAEQDAGKSTTQASYQVGRGSQGTDLARMVAGYREPSLSVPMLAGSAVMSAAPTMQQGSEKATVNVYARPMLSLDRQGGQQLSNTVAGALNRQRFSLAPPGVRTG